VSTILVTGVSGFIGTALAAALAERHAVIGMSRRKPAGDLRWVKGDFAAFEDLRQLDGDRIDAAVHLAAVTGGCLERDGMLVNVEGTRCLMRYLMERGCRKFVMASSIAVVGMQSLAFRPLQAPIPDEHPCLDRDGYGFSKYLMEEVTKYHHRQLPEVDVTNLRLASIAPDEKMPPLREVCPPRMWGLGSLTMMARSDAVRALTMAVEAPYRPGVRILNATCPKAWTAVPVADILRGWWGNDVDLSHYDAQGREKDSVYDVRRIERELGFVARVLPEGV
jgi:UDP-glucose 4-epimerase